MKDWHPWLKGWGFRNLICKERVHFLNLLSLQNRLYFHKLVLLSHNNFLLRRCFCFCSVDSWFWEGSALWVWVDSSGNFGNSVGLCSWLVAERRVCRALYFQRGMVTFDQEVNSNWVVSKAVFLFGFALYVAYGFCLMRDSFCWSWAL